MRARTLSLFLLLTTLILNPATASAGETLDLRQRPELGKVQAHYVILTTFELASAFDSLAEYKRSHGTATVIVAVEQIEALYPEGRDLAESIRLFLQDAYGAWATRYVLLGGTPDVVPTRTVIVPDPRPLFPSTPTDLYYAALDGDWDADGDGIIGELPWYDDPGDEIDTEPELMVGRAPVRSVQEAREFVGKTLRFFTSAASRPERRGLALGSTLPESPGLTLSESSEDVLEVALDSSPSPPPVSRYYSDNLDWPHSGFLDANRGLLELSSGDYDWVLGMLPTGPEGLSVAEEIIAMETLGSIANGPREFVFLSIGSSAAGLDSTGVLEALVRNPIGGAVAAVGPGSISFIALGEEFLREFLSVALSSPDATLGEAMVAAQTTHAGAGNFEVRNNAGWFLLGDPQLTLYQREFVGNPPSTVAAVLHPPWPNPFNPSTAISFDLSSRQTVELAIFDPRGRQVRTLLREVREPGPHEVHWNGRNDGGLQVASGVYVVRLDVDGRQLTRKLALTR